MLSLSSQPPPMTFRERFQQCRRRNSISQQSPPEKQQRRLSARRSLDLALHRNKKTHDEPLPKAPQPAVAEHHHAHQQPSRRQSQPARDSHDRNSGPPRLSRAGREAMCDKQPDQGPPSSIRRRSQSHDYRSTTSSAASQHADPVVQRSAMPARCDAAAGNSNIATAFISPGANEGASGREARVIAATL